MNDHNLDDLIIDNIEPKNKKAKSILTIVALLIVLLIVAIILTSVLLDSPKKDTTLQEDNETEMISPELTLQNVGKVKKPEAESKLNDIIEEALNKPVTAKDTTVEKNLKPQVSEETVPAPEPTIEETIPEVPKAEEIKPEVKTSLETKTAVEEAPEANAQPVEAKVPETKPEPAAEKKAEAAVPASKPAPKKVKPKAASHATAYYIQVGAYRKTPSKQLLRTIKNKGFSYKIITSNGTKKLLIGPYSSKSSVNSALLRVRDRINKQAFIKK